MQVMDGDISGVMRKWLKLSGATKKQYVNLAQGLYFSRGIYKRQKYISYKNSRVQKNDSTLSITIIKHRL